MNTKHILARAVPLVVLMALAACSTVQQTVDTRTKDAEHEASVRQGALRAAVANSNAARIAAQDVERPYIAGNSIPLAREAQMPDALRRSVPVTAMFSSAPVDLAQALQQISSAAGISITATSDALMPPSAFAPRTGLAAATAPVMAPTRVTLRANNTPLWSLLDDVARQADCSWRPVPGGAEFFRVDTRVFELMAIPQTANTSASLGRNAGTNQVFDSQSKSGFTMKDQNLLNGIQKSVEALMTTGGKMTLSQETQSLVVTDTTEALDRIAEYVKEQNKSMSRRVRMIVDTIEVSTKKGNDVGVDWNLVYATANHALSMASPSTLTSALAGSLGDSRKAGPYSGTSVVINALSEIGTVVNRRSYPVLTTSGRPVTTALRTTFNYVDQVQATAIASSVLSTTAQAPTVTQKDETVGTFLTMVPTAKPDGTIFLSVSFDVTSADPLRPFTVGSGASAVTVQQKTINGSGIIQEVPIRSGRTEVIGGIEVSGAQNTSRRLGDGVPMAFGGSDSGNTTHSVLLILVTAVIEEGI